MRVRVASKIWLGSVLIVCLGAIPMLVAYQGVLRLRREMRHLADVKEPSKSAAHEMEINVKGIAVGTLGYLSAPTPLFRDLVADNESDFEEFHAAYLRLATTEEEKRHGETIGGLYGRLKERGRELRDRQDEQVRDFTAVLTNLRRMERLFEGELRAALVPPGPADLAKLEAIGALETDIAEIGMCVAAYNWFRDEGADDLIARNLEACRVLFRRLDGFEWAAESQREALRSLKDTFEKTIAKIHAVRSRLSRAFENLIENAIQHSPEGGTVTVSARAMSENGAAAVEVRVEDRGPGFREDIGRAFELFFTRRQGGTGLGLALVDRIVTSHGGEVEAANGPEGGAVLKVSLPAESLAVAANGRG